MTNDKTSKKPTTASRKRPASKPSDKQKANKPKNTAKPKKSNIIKTVVATLKTGNAQPYRTTDAAATNPAWNEAAWIALVNLATKGKTFTSADILNDLAAAAVKTKDRRSIGGIISEAKNQGLIRCEGFVRRNDKYSRAITGVWVGCCSRPVAPTQTQ